MKKEQKIEALLEAALKLFSERGISNSPTSLIAKNAGVATGTLFFHFSSKEELSKKLFCEICLKVGRKIALNDRDHLPTKDRILGFSRTLFRYYFEHVDVFKFSEEYYFLHKEECDELSPREDDLLINLLKQAQEEDLVENVPLVFLTTMLIGPVNFLLREHIYRNVPVTEELIEKTIEASWKAIEK